jgi:6-phosphofructokinase 1
MGTDHTPGFGSAAKYVASSMLEIFYDSAIYKLNAVTIVEIMGRNAGWLTAASALARENGATVPDLIYLPEVPFDTEKFLEDIREKFKEKSSIIIAVSEGIKDANGQYLDQDSKYTKKDAFGHVLHSGTGKVLETIVYKEFRCKVRSIELNVLQRCAMHIASKTDIEESFEIGQFAVTSALNNETGIMIVSKRESNMPYKVHYEAMDVLKVANLEHKIPEEWINDAHNDITPALHDYLYPLIQGEMAIKYTNGIPTYLDITHLKNNIVKE